MKEGAQNPTWSCRGFTLIELLAVIAITLVLATLLLGGVGKVREAAEKAKCASHLRALGVGILAYAGDNNGRLPPGARSNMGGTLEDILADGGYTEAKKAPLVSADVFYCPTNQRLQSPPAGGYPTGPGGTGYKGWAGYMIGYTFNASLFKQTNSTIGNAGYTPDSEARVSLASIKLPSRTVALLDMYTRPLTVSAPPSSGLAKNTYFNPASSSFGLGTIHNGLGNILFLDGHVESFSRNAPLSVCSLPGQEEPWNP